ncbi:hypothetical protein HDU67_005226 [Dinochytrium kinnereticum]|nr:hypothetical protein HDU67_005226 [Dinochytrium kinnereticum]
MQTTTTTTTTAMTANASTADSTAELIHLTGLHLLLTPTATTTSTNFVIVMDASPSASATNTLFHLRQKIAARLRAPEPDINLFRLDEPLSLFDPRVDPVVLRTDLREMRRQDEVDEMVFGGRGADAAVETDEVLLLPYDVTRLFRCTWILDLFVPVTEYFGVVEGDGWPSLGMLKILVTVGKEHVGMGGGEKGLRGQATRKRIQEVFGVGDVVDDLTLPVKAHASSPWDAVSAPPAEPTMAWSKASSRTFVPPRRLPPSSGGSWYGDAREVSTGEAASLYSPAALVEEYQRSASLDLTFHQAPLRRSDTFRQRQQTDQHSLVETASVVSSTLDAPKVVHLPGVVVGKDPTSSTFVMVVEDNASLPSLLFRVADRIGHPREMVHQIVLFAWPGGDTGGGVDLFDARLRSGEVVRGVQSVAPNLTVDADGVVRETGVPFTAGVSRQPQSMLRGSRFSLFPSGGGGGAGGLTRKKTFLGRRKHLHQEQQQQQHRPSSFPSSNPLPTFTTPPKISDVIPILFPGVAWIPPSLAMDPAVPVSSFFKRSKTGGPWDPTRLRLFVSIDPLQPLIDFSVVSGAGGGVGGGGGIGRAWTRSVRSFDDVRYGEGAGLVGVSPRASFDSFGPGFHADAAVGGGVKVDAPMTLHRDEGEVAGGQKDALTTFPRGDGGIGVNMEAPMTFQRGDDEGGVGGAQEGGSGLRGGSEEVKVFGYGFVVNAGAGRGRGG